MKLVGPALTAANQRYPRLLYLLVCIRRFNFEDMGGLSFAAVRPVICPRRKRLVRIYLPIWPSGKEELRLRFTLLCCTFSPAHATFRLAPISHVPRLCGGTSD